MATVDLGDLRAALAAGVAVDLGDLAGALVGNGAAYVEIGDMTATLRSLRVVDVGDLRANLQASAVGPQISFRLPDGTVQFFNGKVPFGGISKVLRWFRGQPVTPPPPPPTGAFEAGPDLPGSGKPSTSLIGLKGAVTVPMGYTEFKAAVAAGTFDPLVPVEVLVPLADPMVFPAGAQARLFRLLGEVAPAGGGMVQRFVASSAVKSGTGVPPILADFEINGQVTPATNDTPTATDKGAGWAGNWGRSHVTAYRGRLFNIGGDGIKGGGSQLWDQCIVHRFGRIWDQAGQAGPAHSDPVQMSQGDGFEFARGVLLGVYYTSGIQTTSGMLTKTEGVLDGTTGTSVGNIDHVTIRDSWLDGGTITIQFDSTTYTRVLNYQLLRNKFGSHWTGAAIENRGYIPPTAIITENVWETTFTKGATTYTAGQPVPF